MYYLSVYHWAIFFRGGKKGHMGRIHLRPFKMEPDRSESVWCGVCQGSSQQLPECVSAKAQGGYIAGVCVSL